MKIRKDSIFGLILTTVSVMILVLAVFGGIATMVYAAFWLNSAMAMGIIILIIIALPIMWLGWEDD